MDAFVYQSTEYCRNRLLTGKPKDLPWEKLKPGLSFFVPFGIVEEPTFRSAVSTASNRYNKKFRCIKNEELNCFEITVVEGEVEVTTFTIYESSPQAKAIIMSESCGKKKYPLEQLPAGKSFIFPLNGTNEESLRTACSVNSKKYKCKFVCIKHEVEQCLEVYHVPIEQYKKIEASNPSPTAVRY